MTDKINKELTKFYGNVAAEFLAVGGIRKQHVGPFLVACPKAYSKLVTKWLYVGQETLGWGRLGSVDDVRALMRQYEEFNLAEHYSGAGSPFWSFGHALDKQLNPDGPSRSFIWSNLARLGKAGEAGRVPDEYLDFWLRKRILATEIKLFSPTLVVFATGPSYDDLLSKEFPGIELQKLSITEPVSRVRHAELPQLTFRSYHPAFLRRHRLEQRVRDFISRKAHFRPHTRAS